MDIVVKAEISQRDIDRFWSKCFKSDYCWNWIACISSDGYGKFSLKRKNKTVTLRSHRVSYFLTYGEINDKLLICHKCDNKKCINPEHLFEGTVKDNILDAKAKGLLVHTKGEQCSDLTEEQVLNIRNRVIKGEKQINIARETGVGKNAIWYIVNRITWKHI